MWQRERKMFACIFILLCLYIKTQIRIDPGAVEAELMRQRPPIDEPQCNRDGRSSGREVSTVVLSRLRAIGWRESITLHAKENALLSHVQCMSPAPRRAIFQDLCRRGADYENLNHDAIYAGCLLFDRRAMDARVSSFDGVSDRSRIRWLELHTSKSNHRLMGDRCRPQREEYGSAQPYS
jgi:hypothetical protein